MKRTEHPATITTKVITDKTSLHFAKCGDTLYVFDHESESTVLDEIERKMKREGCAVERNGVKRWYDDRVVFDAAKVNDDGNGYTWDKSGNRVLYERYEVTIASGKRTERLIRKIYKNYINGFDA